MAQKFDARQTISRDVLANLLGINGTELDDLLRALNKEVNAPLRIAATTPTADSKINFQASEVEAADLAAKNASPVSSQIPSFPASTIDFQSGATTGGTFNIVFPNSTVGFFRRIGFSLDASGTIQCLFSAEAASLGALANAGTVFVKGALPIGWIDLEATAASPGRFKTAGSATNIIENKVSGSNRVHRIIGGGGSGGTGTGSGTGDDINALTFKASFTDLFSDLPTDAVSAVDYTAGKTDSTTYDIVNSYHRLAYDATRTVTGTGVNMTLNLAPAFTIKAGDMLIVGSEARRIASLTSQTVFALESAFTADPSASACTLSQAVHSKDLNNFAADGLAISTAFPTTINQILMTYEDTSAANDLIFDANTVSVIGYSASSDGTNFSSVNIRPQNLSDSQSILNLPTAGTNMYVRLFANKTSGSGFVNVLGYKVFFHRDIVYADGALQNQAYCFTNGTGAEINCSAPVVTSGKTRLQTNFSFPVAVNPGTTNGCLEVYLNGQKVPRFVDSTLTPDASYKEIDQRTIELDQDYSGLPLSLEVIQTVAVVDASDTNTTGVSQLQETMSEGLQGMVKTSSTISASSNTGTPALGTFHSTILNRSAITDLTQDLKVRMGVERIALQQIYPLQNEFGPNGEQTFAVANDDRGLVRFCGTWASFNQNGSGIFSKTNGDFMEVTFYGTGLNLITYSANNSLRTGSIFVDGVAAGTLTESTTSTPTILGVRGYSPNVPLNLASGLPLGVHTVRLTQTSNNLDVYGIEILTETTSLRVNSGTSYNAGKKITTLAQQTVVHNTTFEAGTLGTRGGRVVVYQKADGTIAKAVQPVDAAQANLTSANHQNEEIARTYSFREFGAGTPSVDFSGGTINSNNGVRAFTLEDGTTTLHTSSFFPVNSPAGQPEGVGVNINGDGLILTFVGTGLDVYQTQLPSGMTLTDNVTVDGTIIGTGSAGSLWKLGWNTIVSGLPYGTHTFRYGKTAGGSGAAFSQFSVYQPKKPTVPAGAVELADYNLLANFAANATQDIQRIATGVLRKASLREMFYSGAWTITGPVATSANGYTVSSPISSSFVEYTFWGTGFDLRLQANTNTSTFTLSVDGITNNSAFTSGAYGANLAYNSTSGVITSTAGAGASGAGVWLNGLALGKHTLRVAWTSGTGSINLEGIDVITPMHSYRQNVSAQSQNTLPVGSTSISDNRKTSLIEDTILQPKNWVQVQGQVSSPTTTSGSYVPMPDMSATIKTSGRAIKIAYSASVFHSTTAGTINAQVFVDGLPVGVSSGIQQGGNAATGVWVVSGVINVPVSPGFHTVTLMWLTNTATATAWLNYRSMNVEEV